MLNELGGGVAGHEKKKAFGIEKVLLSANGSWKEQNRIMKIILL